MRPDLSHLHESLGDLLAALWAAIPVDGWLITSMLGAVGFCVAWAWRKWERAHAD
jgi:hypothetical protein